MRKLQWTGAGPGALCLPAAAGSPDQSAQGEAGGAAPASPSALLPSSSGAPLMRPTRRLKPSSRSGPGPPPSAWQTRLWPRCCCVAGRRASGAGPCAPLRLSWHRRAGRSAGCLRRGGWLLCLPVVLGAQSAGSGAQRPAPPMTALNLPCPTDALALGDQGSSGFWESLQGQGKAQTLGAWLPGAKLCHSTQRRPTQREA